MCDIVPTETVQRAIAEFRAEGFCVLRGHLPCRVVNACRDAFWPSLPLAVVVMRGAAALLFGLTPMDAPTVVAATCLLALAGLLAGALPAWRAAQIRPEVVLRCD